MESISLVPSSRTDYTRLIELWEASVRATHAFLEEADIVFYRELILERYFDLVHLTCAKDQNEKILGFIGINDDKIEMLFVDPCNRGCGVGKKLVLYAVNSCSVSKVDVNEQNNQAVGFYLNLGFTIKDRRALDGMGKPYPVLHLELNRH